MGAIVLLVYSVWAVYSGFKFVTGRSEWLDSDAPLNRVVKVLVSLGVGYVIGVFYFLYMIYKFFMSIARS